MYASHIANVNPIRYRGYYYDVETGFYYLQSRYYDPEVGRFINADEYISTGQGILGHNMFAYCLNNPVNRVDPTGELGIINFIVGIVNRIKNSKADEDPSTTTKNKIVNDQAETTGENFEYGFFKTSWNGCGPIAVHNAKVIKGIDSSLSETISDFQMVNAMLLGGALGSNPYFIGWVLRYEGIEYYRVSGTENMTLYGTYIVTYWTQHNTVHNIALSYTSKGCIAYNVNGGGKSTPNFNLNDISEGFMCGYYLP